MEPSSTTTETTVPGELYGVMAEFDNPSKLMQAVRAVVERGYQSIEAYTPFPLHGLPRALGHPSTRLPYLTLLGGILGAAAGWALQYWSLVIDYPLNVGGRPLNSWPAFVPVTFELSVLGAALFSVFGMLALNGLPHPYHPVFHVDAFARASRDRFFLCVRCSDARFEYSEVRRLLEGLPAISVHDVPR